MLIIIIQCFLEFTVTMPKKKQVVQIKVRAEGTTDLNDPSVKAKILQKVRYNTSLILLIS